ncbi:MAG: 8-oxo-dGTP diphosphatase [Patescibacteria group bacterium]
MNTLRNTTLVFLVKKTESVISDICLAMKKRGFGMNRWNGVGGKVNSQETIEEAARREAQEEIGVIIKDLNKVAELAFYFPHNSAWDQMVHVYFTVNWDGDPKESEEMNPKWFSPKELPFQEMWPDDIFWLPQALSGKLQKAQFTFGQNDVIKAQEITIVDTL